MCSSHTSESESSFPELDKFPRLDAQASVSELLDGFGQPEPWYKEDYSQLVKGLTHLDVEDMRTLLVPFGRKVFAVSLSFANVVLMAAGKLGKVSPHGAIFSLFDKQHNISGQVCCCWSSQLFL